jgi:hypothetical protein
MGTDSGIYLNIGAHMSEMINARSMTRNMKGRDPFERRKCRWKIILK